MDNGVKPSRAIKTRQRPLVWYIIIILVCEKIVQHTIVTLAFYNNWYEIRSRVMVNPDVLIISGGIVAVLYVLSFWAMISNRVWVTNLLIGLALFDIVGECVAQGKISIVITVSFVVATLLLILTLVYRRQVMKLRRN
jgi:hypothetical protein